MYPIFGFPAQSFAHAFEWNRRWWHFHNNCFRRFDKKLNFEGGDQNILDRKSSWHCRAALLIGSGIKSATFFAKNYVSPTGSNLLTRSKHATYRLSGNKSSDRMKARHQSDPIIIVSCCCYVTNNQSEPDGDLDGLTDCLIDDRRPSSPSGQLADGRTDGLVVIWTKRRPAIGVESFYWPRPVGLSVVPPPPESGFTADRVKNGDDRWREWREGSCLNVQAGRTWCNEAETRTLKQPWNCFRVASGILFNMSIIQKQFQCFSQPEARKW